MQLQSIFKNFKGFKALNNVNLVLHKSEILGLLGHNGAGKSTLFNIMSNYFGPSQGQVCYYGSPMAERKDLMENLGLCAQDDILWFDLSVDQHLLLYRLLKGIDEVATTHWKILMDLEHFGETEGGALSTGMKRKLCYLISMMCNPRLKFLDEPTSGLDPVSRKAMRNLMKLQRQVFGGSSVFTTHTMEDAEILCDRIAILVNGRLHCIDSVMNLKQLSGGLNLTLVFWPQKTRKDKDKDRFYLIDLFKRNFPESLNNKGQPVILDDNLRKLVFDVKDTGLLSEKLSLLERLKDEGEIFEYQLNHKSLEDLFLNLAKTQTSN